MASKTWGIVRDIGQDKEWQVYVRRNFFPVAYFSTEEEAVKCIASLEYDSENPS